ncbi:ubiquinol-cytochrome c reductase iron-sulfur subunit [Halobacteria archaeon HArc-gm2]|nr:ubiquinol-cytochrome c reductase iron-sulfur subunit [Halobacteria archaeon HArc-gm2]
MPMSDKYPPQSGRRRFVKGMVGSGVASAGATGGSVVADVTTNESGIDAGSTQFVGIANTAGPAPRGMPLIPIKIDDGELKGRYPETVEKETEDGSTYQSAEEELGGLTYSVRWFQFCGVERAEGIQPTADQEDFLRAGGTYSWQGELDSREVLRVEHFSDYEEWGNGVGTAGLGKPAKAYWRSEGEDLTDIPVIVMRSPEVPKMVAGEGEYARLPETVRTFLDAATAEGFIAWLDKCTHFCCVPSFKASGSGKFGAEDMVYCQCHQSVYDPFSPRLLTFAARPRPEP